MKYTLQWLPALKRIVMRSTKWHGRVIRIGCDVCVALVVYWRFERKV